MLALILLICTAGLAYGDGGKSKKLKAGFGMNVGQGLDTFYLGWVVIEYFCLQRESTESVNSS